MPVRREGDGSYTDLGPGSALDYPRHAWGGLPDVPAAPGEPRCVVEVPAWWPECMTDGEYLEWLAADQQLPKRQRVGLPCSDCTAAFARAAGDACNRPQEAESAA